MDPARIPLILAPTPLHRLDRISSDLGLDVWIKRDDLTGFAMGGNKGRKLEYLLAEAIAQDADTIVTCGSTQSNFIRQLGTACAMVGIHCVAATMELPYAAAYGVPPSDHAGLGGNLILDHIVGVELHRFPNDDWEVLYDHAEELAQRAEAKGHRVYRIPVGGSSGLGGYAFYRAAVEVGDDFDTIVTPCSSGSTHAGLAYAFHGTKTRVIGVACDPEPEIMEDLVRIAHEIDDITGLGRRLTEADYEFRLEWAGEAYGIPSPEGEQATHRLACREGIFLDPVYTAKGFAGLLGLAPELSGRILFWHTGGLPALFAHE